MTSPVTTENERQIELSVSGMTCAACAARVERKLNRLDGVSARVNFATGRATVSTHPDVADEMLVQTVVHSGFGAELLPTDGSGEPAPDDDGRSRLLWRRLQQAQNAAAGQGDLRVHEEQQRLRKRVRRQPCYVAMLEAYFQYLRPI